MFILNNQLFFPPVELADNEGLLAIGGDLSIDRLLLAYRQGIFPWYSEVEPILWYSPDPRFVLFPNELHVGKTLSAFLRSTQFTFSLNHSFKEVIRACKSIKRAGQYGTWITEEMEQAYVQLHEKGIAISAECWLGNDLVGGLYGVLLDKVFCGESMFSLQSNASKFAFVRLVDYLKSMGVLLIDCQIKTDYLSSLGGRFISRKAYVEFLK